jgi:hypothetical protein
MLAHQEGLDGLRTPAAQSQIVFISAHMIGEAFNGYEIPLGVSYVTLDKPIQSLGGVGFQLGGIEFEIHCGCARRFIVIQIAESSVNLGDLAIYAVHSPIDLADLAESFARIGVCAFGQFVRTAQSGIGILQLLSGGLLLRIYLINLLIYRLDLLTHVFLSRTAAQHGYP